MEWIFPRMYGIMWNAWNRVVSSLNARKVPSWSMKLTAFYAFNLNDNLKRKADRIMEFVLKTGNMGHNRDMSHFSKYPYLIRKCISMSRRISDLINHARIFPLDSLRFFPRIMFNGVVSTMRGE